MISNFKIITTNHNINSISSIGDYAVQDENKDDIFDKLKSLGIKEILYLSTCNRVLYLFYSHEDIDKSFVSEFLKTIKGSSILVDEFLSKVEVYEGEEAIGHIMEVAGSIDSLVVGEREIFRQYRSSYEEARKNSMIGDNLRILDKAIVKTSKSIYTNTRIGEKPLSVASLAMTSMLESIPSPKNIVFIGAGETNTLLGKLLTNKVSAKHTVFNRSITNAKKLAKLLDGNALTLDKLSKTPDFDILIVCTGSQSIIWTRDMMMKIEEQYGKRKRVLVDLSVPSNIENKIGLNDHLDLISIENLNRLAEINLEARKNEIYLAKEIVADAKKQFRQMYNERKIELAFSNIPEEVNKVKEKAIEEVFSKRLNIESEETKLLIEEMMSYMAKKCISIPIKTAKKNLL